MSSAALFFASLSASSFLSIFLFVLTLCMYSGDCLFCMYFDISCSNSLSGWLFCSVGCLSCVFMRYIELRLSVNMNVWFCVRVWLLAQL
jgi:hypothetical protein